MSNTFFGVGVDCGDAAGLARFWADVLGREVADHPTRDNAVVLVDDHDPMDHGWRSIRSPSPRP
ncbi:MAG: hypothetical protein JWO88_1634 [Frankiales bacterium]|nr:hypothetical protein [Frankiales bacterium]